MEDLELERRVWERVASREAPPREEAMEPLIRQARELAEEYRALAALTGDRGTLAGIRREEQEITRILAGIRALRQGGGSERLQRLRRCYHRSRRAMADYAARLATPEVGLAYQYLSELERRHCLEILRLLGSGKE